MANDLEQMAAFFNRRAQSYDIQHMSMVGGGQEGKDIIAAHLPAHCCDVLDLGCGTGLELEALFARFPKAHVLGIDLAEDMLALLKERCYGYDVKTLCMSYFDYAYPHEAFDAAVSVMSLHHFDQAQKLALYLAVRGSLRPGGVFLNCDYVINSPLAEARNFRRLKRLGLAPGKMHFDTPLTLKHELALLREAGFDRAELVWEAGKTRLIKAE